MNLRQAVAMVKVCEKYGVELRVNQNSCFVPGFLAIEPYLSDKYLGTIYYASIICDGWFLNFPEKHIIPAMMVHYIGLIYKWFGKSKQVYCQAHGNNRSIDQGETMAVTQFTTESDIQGLLSCNWASSGINTPTPMRRSEYKELEAPYMGTAGKWLFMWREKTMRSGLE